MDDLSDESVEHIESLLEELVQQHESLENQMENVADDIWEVEAELARRKATKQEDSCTDSK